MKPLSWVQTNSILHRLKAKIVRVQVLGVFLSLTKRQLNAVVALGILLQVSSPQLLLAATAANTHKYCRRLLPWWFCPGQCPAKHTALLQERRDCKLCAADHQRQFRGDVAM